MAMQLLRTTSDNPHFAALVAELDADLARRDGIEHGFYAQFNKTAALKQVVVLYENDEPIGCGAIRVFDATATEVKRMYTAPAARGKGVATAVLAELEAWAAELGFEKCVLETGKRQPEAIRLYERSGYCRIPNYGPYAGVENSVCFEKML